MLPVFNMVTAVWDKFIESHEYVMNLGDPRTKEWLFVKSPLYPVMFLVMFYMPLVMHGPKIMAFFKPIEAKRALFAFNVFQIMYSTFMWTEFLYLAVSMKYSLRCEPVNSSTGPLEARMAACIWHFYMSKIIDLIDTFPFDPVDLGNKHFSHLRPGSGSVPEMRSHADASSVILHPTYVVKEP
ncbi:unnamed protein product [Notodromas monacha]|uniref:Elongation of very long chain fatty acids protein n=1 Tax=Notodromas monacha TaxID=399045 RepID=A0A7R9GIB0_9CRUS|nr:unnamed protein product [Notodromas monacha]CAG0922246.1 unnamed protein product [Notodromas monacha]